MSRTVYVNGEYLPESEAKISVFDRGFLFSDGVYEVSSVVRGKLLDNGRHLERLARSLKELSMKAPASNDEIVAIQEEVISRNNLDEGMLYLQITRGAADRTFLQPKDIAPTLVMFTQELCILDCPDTEIGISVKTIPDIRWKRRDIKTVSLLAQSMAKQAAVDAGANDAWMVEDGYVTEGSSNNAYIVTDDNTIVTRNISNSILSGITRRAVLKLARQHNMKIEERPFTPEEAENALEAFSTAASHPVMPVVKINGRILSNGTPGPIATSMVKLYREMALKSIGEE